jgi:hypothetical protein
MLIAYFDGSGRLREEECIGQWLHPQFSDGLAQRVHSANAKPSD